MQGNLTDSDRRWLNAAALLAERGRPLSRPNPAVGCVLVKDGRVVGRGWTQPGGRPHAEAMALAAAGAAARGASAYVTLEPCAHQSERGPCCARLLREAGVARVVVGCGDPDPRTAGDGVAMLREAGIAVVEAECAASRASLAGYLMRAESGRPFVTLKLALSIDGCIATASGESQWITGAEARAHTHLERARHDAILVGGGTLRTDRPRLDVRLPGLGTRSPERWVLSRSPAPDGWHRLSDPADLSPLASAQYLFVEGGAQTAAAFLAADHVDRLLVYCAPIVIGGGRPGIADIGLGALAGAHGRWKFADRRMLGADTLEVYARTR
ncbi:bifunctional diaminohydroxyphosphoribosylaminopyrimidine deaminase/5-amino-6-(5-phosphoribosylamino)uracil reductase RibD [Croceicoccus naphthovorans]|uniref:bifunctional diaminohydroxyphosphoribosylaminopyrimidine deaminase/5-amino-6-(5-phosphoribosylamino)uracil reductase RibD n=1 Tax=Croceicoccus naphthovorans TaxID=1348774 RepID=UPI0017A2DF4D|nr:bifunctional diaminohydroxyphosphoribosylaminopyrimidine deaminase/5-amino-6-(5-phosphoribosylamino)uracil reductase RibD [Croceicoccus naphthovorans]MBB3991710.1 diaminohydroxyphosphoribosylaminopyrimidine deaminase/5-amino-6-(5-phosphoribosylamino)uracil reductase [Croceicoccus naphthovorans]